MPDSLNDLIEKTINSNDRLLNRGKQKLNNQTFKESELKRKLKKGVIYAAVISALTFGIYGTNQGVYKYKAYISQKNKEIGYYQKKFDEVQHHYNNRDYVIADRISESLQEELGKEWFFSPTSSLYKEVKKYDDEIIDPEIKRIKREKLYTSLKGFPRNVFYKLEEKWDNATKNERLFVYICGAGLLIYLLKKR